MIRSPMSYIGRKKLGVITYMLGSKDSWTYELNQTLRVGYAKLDDTLERFVVLWATSDNRGGAANFDVKF